jgi:glycosyltransferase involved in cell wall biosynthesis
VPTYNRRALLRRTLDSLLAAEVPDGLEARVTVVDNNSKDDTRQEVESRFDDFGGRLRYVFEAQQGRSPALNAGIRATDGDLVGTIDDDEEVDRNWFRRAHAAFASGGVDFIGGPYVPRWGAERPDWLPEDYPAAIGHIDCGDEVLPYDDNFPGILMGGNAVFTRAVLDRVGLYSTALGRNGTRLLTGEDEDMYKRLRAAGARGLYLPDLIIYHYVPPERLTKSYHRRWCFWHSVSQGVLDRAETQPVKYLGGVPRHLYGRAARCALRKVRGGRNPSQSFSDELAVVCLAGFFYGKHFYRLPG